MSIKENKMGEKKIKEMTKEERKAYQREWYANKVASNSNKTVSVTIHNVSDEFMQLLLTAMKEGK